MEKLFSVYLTASFFGSVMILLVLLLRPVFRKAPRNVLCVLWLLVAVRLLLPYQIESQLSLQPSFGSAVTTLLEKTDTIPDYAPTVPDSLQETTTAPAEPMPLPENSQGAEKIVDCVQILSVIWLGAAGALVLYAMVTYCALKRRVRDAVLCKDGAWESDAIRGAFLLGFFRPKIFLPLGLSTQDREFIVMHERVHMGRGDNWWKLLGMLCTCIHWYNPLVWVSYVLLCRDVELACDERAICSLTMERRKAYSYALLNCGKRTSKILTYPVAFGEVSLKQRIRNVLSYRSPNFWLTMVAVVLAAGITVCFMTTPDKKVGDIQQNTHTAGTEEPAQGTESTEITESTKSAEATQVATEPSQPVIMTQPPVTEPVNTQPSEENSVYVISGAYWSKNGIMWKFDSAGGLTFAGNGYMSPLYQGTNYPWKEYSDSITKVVVEDGITNVPRDAFSEMDQITEVYLGNTITNIDKYAFEKCTALRSITIPNSTTTIGDAAFRKCSELKSITIPESVTSLGRHIFRDSGIKEIVFLGDAPKTIHEYAFEDTTTTVYYPKDNPTWTEEVRDNYGGHITWVAK